MSAIFDALSEPASERITAGLARIGLAIRSRAWKGAGPAGLTPTQAQVLALLRGRRQGLSLSAVAEALSVTAPTASDAVASLVAKSLLSKSRGADRRAVVLTPTPEGLALADRAAEWPDFVARAKRARRLSGLRFEDSVKATHRTESRFFCHTIYCPIG